jgi:hypothetical protein
MTESEERKNRRTGMLVSVALHAGIIIMFFFILAWKEPYPPAPEYGIELNFGLDVTGSGVVQPETTREEAASTSAEESGVTEDGTPEQEQEQDNSAEDQTKSEISPDTESPDQVEIKSGDVSEETKPVIPEPQKEESEKKETTETGKTGDPNQGATSSQPVNSSHGDNAKSTGDKGDPQGTIDARALYGTPGGGDGGPVLDMAGWEWDSEPKPDDTSNENGRIVFEIKIDDQGEILSVKTLERTVSPAVEKIYRQSLENLTFSQLSTNSRPAPVSTGKVTFIIRSR